MKRLLSRWDWLVVCTLAVFNFVFLCEEFVFDGMMAFVTSEQGVVHAQNIILGASVLGFVSFPLLRKGCSIINKYVLSAALVVICCTCMVIIYKHPGYVVTLAAGIIAYILFGLCGASVCYFATKAVTRYKNMAKIVGCSYALGVFIQYLNNNLVKHTLLQTIVLVFALVLLVVFTHILYKACVNKNLNESIPPAINRPAFAAMALVVSVALMTCIFSTLDNAVTMVHTSGDFNIGQWPRLILALSGLLAGIVYDLFERKYMSIMMYIVTLLATICVIVITLGGSFISGLIIFYISAGFFVVFFMTSFMDLSSMMKEPSIWAGMGRAINNLCAIITSWISVGLLAAENKMVILILALVLFAGINAALIVYFVQIHLKNKEEQDVSFENNMDGERLQRLVAFSTYFKLTKREQEILEVLLNSEDNVQEIAKKINISRAALYRHISSINEKTNTKKRVGLLQFFYSWECENETH